MARIEEGLEVSTLARPRGDLARLPWVSFFIIAFLVVVAVLAPLVAPHSPTEQALPDKLGPPAWQEGGSTKHRLGTDSLGRDVLSRLIYGARVSLIVAAAALLAGGGVGLMVGIVSGYLGGRVDSFLMRVVDATLTFPTILIALLLAVSLGQGLQTIAIAITVLIWARFARVVRGEVLAVKARDFVALARVHGCSHLRIMAVHIVPNVLNTFMVLLTLHIGFVIIVEASLSFLGAGIPPPTPSWGQMVADGRSHIASAWCLSVVRLLPEPAGRIVEGQVLLEGEDLVTKSESEMRRVRGSRISMILQDPQTSLNPVFTIGDQIVEALRLHHSDGERTLATRAEEALRRVKVAAPEQRMRAYPHQMSGGMKQRVVGALAVAGEPRVLIADEPTTALDVTIQLQYLALLKELQARTRLAMLFITHDFGIVARMCDRVAVMYAGRIVETGPTRTLFRSPRHPYTEALMAAVPRMDGSVARLPSIAGPPPPLHVVRAGR